MKKFYITTAIPYVNAKPHIGHALEFVQADTIARYHRHILKEDVMFLSGGDENALKNVQAAEKEGLDVQTFIDTNAQAFLDLSKQLNVQFDIFQKGSNTKTHFPSCQKLWELCREHGDIYKKTYQGLYCLGCESFYTGEELDEKGECFEHPGKALETISEENYFFKLSSYQNQLIDLISSDTIEIVPEIRKNEMLSFLRQPLQDISISRSNDRAKNWGVPVPNDPTQRMYVWFDALNIYQSGIGFGWDEKTYSTYWPADVHVIGKGITRFHTVYWPAFLISAKLKLPKTVFVHGYFTVEGQKMSKSLGNVVDPFEMIKRYGTDPLRYYFLREIPSFSDGDFSESRFRELYNADLANGLGNLVARVAKLCEKHDVPGETLEKPDSSEPFITALESFQFNIALEYLWQDIRNLDVKLSSETPWKLSPEEAIPLLTSYAAGIRQIAWDLQPFMPDTSKKILDQYTAEKITSTAGLFPRLA